VETALRTSGIQEGLCLVNAMHISASVFINDDERGLHADFNNGSSARARKAAWAIPPQRYRRRQRRRPLEALHHGREVVVAVTKGRLDFGPWEQIFYGSSTACVKSACSSKSSGTNVIAERPTRTHDARGLGRRDPLCRARAEDPRRLAPGPDRAGIRRAPRWRSRIPAPGESALRAVVRHAARAAHVAGNPRRAEAMFKRFTLASFPPEAADRVFRTSGTTGETRGEHRMLDHESLQGLVLAGWRQLKLPKAHPIILAPRPADVPDSSLSQMLHTLAKEVSPNGRATWLFKANGKLDVAWMDACTNASWSAQPIALLGTALAFLNFSRRWRARTFCSRPAAMRWKRAGSRAAAATSRSRSSTACSRIASGD